MTEKSARRPSLIFFGTPDFAVASLAALIQHRFPILSVVTAPDKPAGRGKKLHASAVKLFAQEHHLPVLQPEKLKSPDFLAQLSSLQADVHIVVAFRMLPEVVWQMPPMGTINVHASLLPQYRGAAPINHALMNGETETGVTTFRLQHEIDTGDLLLQKKVAIAPEDNFGSLYPKLMNAGADLLVETLAQLQAGTLVPTPQRNTISLHPAPKIFQEDCRIDWSLPAKKVHDLIRALSPKPAAFTYLQDKKLKILKADYQHASTLPSAGSMETDHKTYLRIAAKDGWVNLLYLQMEGKKAMGIKDFLNGYAL